MSLDKVSIDTVQRFSDSPKKFGLFLSGEKADNGCMAEAYRVERWNGVGAPDAEALRERMEAEGFGVYRWCDRPGAAYEVHTHSDDQSHWVISGEIEFEVEGIGIVRLGAGDRDFMPAGTEHSARVVGDEPVTYLIGEKY